MIRQAWTWCIAATLLTLAATTGAQAAQPHDKTWDLCQEQVAMIEHDRGIPAHLLEAISVAESGRWNETRKATVAWPWTVMAEGRGRFFPSSHQAIAEVEALRARGIRNIDVGCMQVNLYYHGDAFASLEEAFDPAINVAYAATHLGLLQEQSNSWQLAAGHYHSRNPEYNTPYRAKVERLWSQQRRLASLQPAIPADRNGTNATAEGQAEAKAETDNDATPGRFAKVDIKRTAEFNARLRQVRANERQKVQAGVRDTRERDWSQVNGRMLGNESLAAMRRLDTQRRRELDRAAIMRDRHAPGWEKARGGQLERYRIIATNGSS